MFLIDGLSRDNCGHPDRLTSHYSIFWEGYLKDRIYATAPTSIAELKNSIAEEMVKVTPKMLRHVARNMLHRAQVCEANSGTHFCNDFV